MQWQYDQSRFPSAPQNMNPLVRVNVPYASTSNRPAQLPIPASARVHPATQSSSDVQTLSSTNTERTLNVTPSQPIDYRLLLLSLTDEYIAAARRVAALIAHHQDGADINRYHELTAAGMRCLEACLHKDRMPEMSPRQEALLQLRYVSLLYEETTNYREMEERLSKSILFCDRHRLIDVKYAMNHLLARIFAKTNFRTAIKHLEKMLTECETLQILHWIYAFRFLHCSVLLQSQTPRDRHAAFLGLRKLGELATQRHDSEIVVAATLAQAVYHLQARRDDSAFEAQRAIATARAQLSNLKPEVTPQLFALACQLDLMSSLDPFDRERAAQKATDMQELVEKSLKNAEWSQSGDYVLRFNGSGKDDLISDSGGVFGRRKDLAENGVGLASSWLSRDEARSLANMLCTMTGFHRNGSKPHRAETYAKNALGWDDHVFSNASRDVPLSVAAERAQWRGKLRCLTLLQLALCFAGRNEWARMQEALKQFHTTSKLLDTLPKSLKVMGTYLEGAMHQGNGNLDVALRIFQSAELTLDSSRANALTTIDIFKILAAMNILFIIRSPSHPQHYLGSDLLEKLRSYYPSSQSHDTSLPQSISQRAELTAVFHLIFTLCYTPSVTPAEQNGMVKQVSVKPIIAPKQGLQAALNAAKMAHNAILQSIVLSYVHNYFFAGTFRDARGAQFITAANAKAKEADNKLWVEVTADIMKEENAQQ